ncbi:MAG: hypothetical protein K0R54_4492 [Clostridiaceae bacterium]|jgi:hypothetical protein|nr:hypothetical protein [Clostridiaceae bacterium]
MKSEKVTIITFIILNILLILFIINDIKFYNNVKNKSAVIRSYTNTEQITEKNENKFGYKELMDNIIKNDEIKVISMGKLNNNNSVNIKFSYNISGTSMNDEFNKIKQWNNIRNINKIEINMKDIDKWYAVFDMDFIINK